MSKKTLDGGDLLVRGLLKEGVKYLFGITGGELLRIYDAIYRFGRDEGLETIMVRYEQNRAHTAMHMRGRQEKLEYVWELLVSVLCIKYLPWRQHGQIQFPH